jgi:hypothetical protein
MLHHELRQDSWMVCAKLMYGVPRVKVLQSFAPVHSVSDLVIHGEESGDRMESLECEGVVGQQHGQSCRLVGLPSDHLGQPMKLHKQVSGAAHRLGLLTN